MQGEFYTRLTPPAHLVENAESSKEQKFYKAISEGINLGIATVRERFENPERPENKQAYHVSDHTIRVINVSEWIATAIHRINPSLITEKDIMLIKLFAAHHDRVQNGKLKQIPDPNNDGKVMLKFIRDTVANEKTSAVELIEYMNMVNGREREEIFTKEDKEEADETMMLTVPNFDVEKGTVTQPEFGKRRIKAQIVALADLANSGVGKLEDTKHDIAALLIEENPDIAALTEESTQIMSPDFQDWFKRRIIEALKSQQRFILGRKAQTAEDIATMHPDAQTALVGFFPNFDANAQGIEKLVEEKSEKTLSELMIDIHNILNPNYLLVA